MGELGAPPTCTEREPSTASRAPAGVRVTLATGISEAGVRQANRRSLAPGEVDVAEWAADPDTLVVPDAGEVLYRLR